MRAVIRGTFIVLILIVVSLSVFAQDVAEQRLTIHVEGVYARTALAQIRVATGVLFVYE